jgi:hypothetical protein
VIDNRNINGVLNRVTHVPLQHLASAPDYQYATQEYTAFFMSWLYALPAPIYNTPDALGLCGAWRHISEWVTLAAAAGLPTPDYRQTSNDQINETIEARRLLPVGTPSINIIVVGRHVFGPTVSTGIREGCLELARLSRTQLLGIELAFDASLNSWAFASATPMPDLRMGGELFLDALATELSAAGNGGLR